MGEFDTFLQDVPGYTPEPQTQASAPKPQGGPKNYLNWNTQDYGTGGKGMNPQFMGSVSSMAADFYKATGRPLRIVSGYRPTWRQAEIYASGVRPAAKPGHSRHEHGEAIDIDKRDLADLRRMDLSQYGLETLARINDPSHIQAINRDGGMTRLQRQADATGASAQAEPQNAFADHLKDVPGQEVQEPQKSAGAPPGPRQGPRLTARGMMEHLNKNLAQNKMEEWKRGQAPPEPEQPRNFGAPSPDADYSGTYNTPIPPEKQGDFEEWLDKQSTQAGRDIRADAKNYDMQGAFMAGASPGKDGHWTDKFKKPNHPTFSDQSKYHGKDNYYGGTWKGDEFVPAGKTWTHWAEDAPAKIWENVSQWPAREWNSFKDAWTQGEKAGESVKEASPTVKFATDKAIPWLKEGTLGLISRYAASVDPASFAAGQGIDPNSPEMREASRRYSEAGQPGALGFAEAAAAKHTPVLADVAKRSVAMEPKSRTEFIYKALEPHFLPEGKVEPSNSTEALAKDFITMVPDIAMIIASGGFGEFLAEAPVFAGTALGRFLAGPVSSGTTLGAYGLLTSPENRVEHAKSNFVLGATLGVSNGLSRFLPGKAMKWAGKFGGAYGAGYGQAWMEGLPEEQRRQNGAMMVMFDAMGGINEKQAKALNVSSDLVNEINGAIKGGEYTPATNDAVNEVRQSVMQTGLSPEEMARDVEPTPGVVSESTPQEKARTQQRIEQGPALGAEEETRIKELTKPQTLEPGAQDEGEVPATQFGKLDRPQPAGGDFTDNAALQDAPKAEKVPPEGKPKMTFDQGQRPPEREPLRLWYPGEPGETATPSNRPLRPYGTEYTALDAVREKAAQDTAERTAEPEKPKPLTREEKIVNLTTQIMQLRGKEGSAKEVQSIEKKLRRLATPEEMAAYNEQKVKDLGVPQTTQEKIERIERQQEDIRQRALKGELDMDEAQVELKKTENRIRKYLTREQRTARATSRAVSEGDQKALIRSFPFKSSSPYLKNNFALEDRKRLLLYSDKKGTAPSLEDQWLPELKGNYPGVFDNYDDPGELLRDLLAGKLKKVSPPEWENQMAQRDYDEERYQDDLYSAKEAARDYIAERVGITTEGGAITEQEAIKNAKAAALKQLLADYGVSEADARAAIDEAAREVGELLAGDGETQTDQEGGKSAADTSGAGKGPVGEEPAFRLTEKPLFDEKNEVGADRATIGKIKKMFPDLTDPQAELMARDPKLREAVTKGNWEAVRRAKAAGKISDQGAQGMLPGVRTGGLFDDLSVEERRDFPFTRDVTTKDIQARAKNGLITPLGPGGNYTRGWRYRHKSGLVVDIMEGKEGDLALMPGGMVGVKDLMPGQTIAGAHRPTPYGSFIELAKDSGPRTFDHEWYHMLKRWFATPEETAKLSKRFKDEEAEARYFETWEPAKEPNTLWQKIKNYAQDLFKSLTGYESVDDIMGRYHRGEVMEREPAKDFKEMGPIEAERQFRLTDDPEVTPEERKEGVTAGVKSWVKKALDNSREATKQTADSLAEIGSSVKHELGLSGDMNMKMLIEGMGGQRRDAYRRAKAALMQWTDDLAKLDPQEQMLLAARYQKGMEVPERFKLLFQTYKELGDQRVAAVNAAGGRKITPRDNYVRGGNFSNTKDPVVKKNLNNFLDGKPFFNYLDLDEQGRPFESVAAFDKDGAVTEINRTEGGQVGEAAPGMTELYEQLKARGRTLTGGRQYFKGKVLPSWEETLMVGFKPKYGLMDLMLYDLASKDHYIYGMQLWNEAKGKGMIQYMKPGKVPPGYDEIMDQIGAVDIPFLIEKDTGGIYMRDRVGQAEAEKIAGRPFQEAPGDYDMSDPERTAAIKHLRAYAPKDVAKPLNNFLSKGLKGQAWYDHTRTVIDAARKAGVSWSPFHIKMTYNTDVAFGIGRHGADAIGKLFTGDFEGARKSAADLGKTLAGKKTYDGLINASKVTADYYAGKLEGVNKAGVEMFLNVGGDLPDPEVIRGWATNLARGFKEAGKQMGDAHLFKALAATAEGTSAPIMGHMVPYAKLESFLRKYADLMPKWEAKWEGRTDSPEAMDDLKFQAREIRRLDDALYGQVAYDNFHFRNFVKDSLFFLIKYPGWNLGSGTWIAANLKGSYEGVRSALGGKEMTPFNKSALQFTFGLMAKTMIYGGLISYGIHRKWPNPVELMMKGIWTGGYNRDGSKEYIRDADYMRDLVGMIPISGGRLSLENPLATIRHKLPGITHLPFEILANEDYFGGKVISYDQPWRWPSKIGGAVAKEFMPYSVQQAWKGRSLPGKLGQLAGFSITPVNMSRSNLESKVAEHYARSAPRGETAEEREKYEARLQVEDLGKQGNKEAFEKGIQTLKDQYGYTDRQIQNLRRRAAGGEQAFGLKLTRFQGLPFDEALNAYSKGSPEEKKLYGGILLGKIERLKPADYEKKLPRIRRTLGLPEKKKENKSVIND